jgi:hypothetical protein
VVAVYADALRVAYECPRHVWAKGHSVLRGVRGFKCAVGYELSTGSVVPPPNGMLQYSVTEQIEYEHATRRICAIPKPSSLGKRPWNCSIRVCEFGNVK